MDNIIGRDTKLLFDFNPVEIPSKIDTGAETNSIHCKNILLKNGILYCDILELGEMLPFSKFKTKRVKSSNGIDNERYCISLPFTLNGDEYISEFTLNDRSNMVYPILIGKNFLMDNGFMVDVNQTINERIIKKSIKKILKENVDNKLYQKIASVINPPYVVDMDKMGLSDKEILKVLEIIFGMELKIYGIDRGGDVYVHAKRGGQWIYYEEFNGIAWEIQERNENDDTIRKYGFDGDEYFDQIVKPLDLSGLNNVRV
jgi:hypothetical protein